MWCYLRWTIFVCDVGFCCDVPCHNQEEVSFSDMFCFHLVCFVLVWCDCHVPLPSPFRGVCLLVGMCALPLVLFYLCSKSSSHVVLSVPLLTPL